MVKSIGDAMKRILVQAGHMRPLQPHHETQTGAPGEAQLVADIQRALVTLLEADENFDPLPMPGRITPDGVRVDGAVFLHADGASAASARGFSLGFPDVAVNRRLAELVAEEIEKLPDRPPRRPDNNTAGMAEYYGFSHVSTPGPEVLIEHGFVTNPVEHAWLKRNVEQLARAEHIALRRFFGVPVGPGNGTLITPDTVLLASPRARTARAERYLLERPHGEYTDDDVRTIVRGYYTTAEEVGLDPLLVVSQMVLETAHLTSFWSQRPRRNPAGIGVTGAPGAGLSFPSWAIAIRAHTGRLLAYALPAGAENDVQAGLIQEALAFRPLPQNRRGVARHLRGLSGTWAIDLDYADKISRIANDIRATDA
jgi:hypothetical protein